MSAAANTNAGRHKTLPLELGKPVFSDAVSSTHLARKANRPDAEWIEVTEVANAVSTDPAIRVSFVHDSQLASSVKSRHFLRPLHTSTREDQLVFTTEHLPGERLHALVHARRVVGSTLPMEVVLRIFLDVVEGLRALHQRQGAPVVHGDVTPASIIVTHGGSSLLVHSGIAAAAKLPKVENPRLAYKAPEQFRESQKATPATDVYSVGMTMWEALTGRLPERRPDTNTILPKFSEVAPSGIPEKVSKVIERCVAFEPSDRYPSARELHEELLLAAAADLASELEVSTLMLATTRPALASVPDDGTTSVVSPAPLPPPRPPPRPSHERMQAVAAHSATTDDDAVTTLFNRDTDAPGAISEADFVETAPERRIFDAEDATERMDAPLGADEPEQEGPARAGRGWMVLLWGFAAVLAIAVVLLELVTPKGGTDATDSSDKETASSKAKGSESKGSSKAATAIAKEPTKGKATCAADLQTDAKNCGACGVDCGGAKCLDGRCGVIDFVSDQNRPSAVAADDKAVYWTNYASSGSVVAVPLAGGSPKTLAEKQNLPDGIAVDNGTVYWTTGKGSIMSVPSSGGKLKTLASGQSHPSAITAKGDSVYWVNQTSNGSVMSVPAGGGKASQLVESVSMPCGIAVDDTSVFYSSYSLGTVARVPRSGGKPIELAAGQAFPCAVDVVGDAVYWVNTGKPSSVMKVSLKGGKPKALVADTAAPSGLAVGEGHAFWTTTGQRGALMRVALSGGKPETVASGVGNPAGVVIGGGSAIFADYSGGAIKRVFVGGSAEPALIAASHTKDDPHAGHVMPAMTASAAGSAEPAPAASAPAPAAPAAPAAADGPVDVTIEIASKGNLMAFDITELTVKAGQRVKVIFKNVATHAVMKHNWVLVKPGTEEEVAAEGLEAGEANHYIVFTNPDVLAATKLAKPGETVEVVFTAPAAGTYPYVCTFPGHYMMMKGTLTVTP